MNRTLVPVAVLAGLTASACLGGGASSPAGGSSTPSNPPPGQHQSFRIAVRINTCTTPMAGPCGLIDRHYSLTCNPAGGTMPNPPAACAAIADYLRRPARPSECPVVSAGAGVSSSTIAGTFDRRPLHLRITSGSSWCGQPRSLQHDYWTLSTFPCNVVVTLSHYGHSYANWARASGCESRGA